MSVSRRALIRAAGTSTTAVTAAALAGCRSGSQDDHGRGWFTVPAETRAPTLCRQCPGGCGLDLRLAGVEAVGVAGNPVHPINRGGVCPRAFSVLRQIHAMDRFRQPMIRSDPGAPLQPLDWNRATGLVSERMRALLAAGRGGRIAVLRAEEGCLRDVVWHRFCRAVTGMRQWVTGDPATAFAMPGPAGIGPAGSLGAVTVDFARADLILSLGVDLFETWASPVHAQRAFAALRRRPGRSPGQLIYSGVRLSHTAVVADRYVPVAPGRQIDLVLALAGHLLADGGLAPNTVARRLAGLDGFRIAAERFANHGMALTATGLSASAWAGLLDRLRLAKAPVVIGPGPGFGSGGRMSAVQAGVAALNLLLGAAEPGGALVHSDPRATADLAVVGDAWPSPVTTLDAAARSVLEAIDGDGLDLLFLSGLDVTRGYPQAASLTAALRRVPLVVGFSTWPDAASDLAHMVLPDAPAPERWVDHVTDRLGGGAVVSVLPPAVPARHLCRDSADVVLGLARSLGGDVADELPWQRYDQLLQTAVAGLFAAGRGAVESAKGTTLVPDLSGAAALWQVLQAGAVWRGDGPVGLSAAVTSRLRTLVASQRTWPSPALSGTVGGLTLHLFAVSTRAWNGLDRQPWLDEHRSVVVPGDPAGWAEMHPQTLAAHGLRSGDRVRLKPNEASATAISLTLRAVDGLVPGVLAVPANLAAGPDPWTLLAALPAGAADWTTVFVETL